MDNWFLVFPIALLIIWFLFRWTYKVRFGVPYYFRIIYELPFFFIFIDVIELILRVNNLGYNKIHIMWYCIILTIVSVVNLILSQQSIRLYLLKLIRKSIFAAIVNFGIVVLISIYIWYFINSY